MKKIIAFSLSIFLLIPMFSVNNAQADDFICTDTELIITVRDAEDNLLGGINYQLWEQIDDADGNPVGNKKVKSGKTNTTGAIGQAEVSFKVLSNEDDIKTPYAIKLYQNSDLYGSFWFYDYQFNCGSRYTVEYNLSTLKVKFRQTDNTLIYNQKFDIYQRQLDADGKPYAGSAVKKGVTTGDSGEANLYLPTGYYFIVTTVDNITYEIANVLLTDQNVTSIDYTPSNTNIILRDGFGDPLEGKTINIYLQELDVNNSKILGKKIKTVKTNSAGEVNTTLNNDTYTFEIIGDNYQKYYVWDIHVNVETALNFNYKLSGIRVILKDSEQNLITNKTVEVYQQDKDVESNVILGKKLSSQRTSEQGYVSVLYPAGDYVLRIPSDAKKYYYEYFNVSVTDQTLTDITKVLPKFRVHTKPADGNGTNQTVNVYEYKYDATANQYTKGIKLTAVKTDTTRGVGDVYLPNGSYFIEYKDEIKKITTSNVFHEYTLTGSGGDSPVQPGSSTNNNNQQRKLAERLKGKILLQVEDHGEAWYVHDDGQRYYLRDRESAFNMLRKFGLGISDENINKIPIGNESRFADIDADSDTLPDKLEEAVGTDPNNPDSDGDGYLDGVEVFSGYSPLSNSATRIQYSQDLSERLKGKILLQVESRGEAWYLNPADGKRYYMKNGEAAFSIMRFLSLGISNSDLNDIAVGTL